MLNFPAQSQSFMPRTQQRFLNCLNDDDSVIATQKVLRPGKNILWTSLQCSNDDTQVTERHPGTHIPNFISQIWRYHRHRDAGQSGLGGTSGDHLTYLLLQVQPSSVRCNFKAKSGGSGSYPDDYLISPSMEILRFSWQCFSVSVHLLPVSD